MTDTPDTPRRTPLTTLVTNDLTAITRGRSVAANRLPAIRYFAEAWPELIAAAPRFFHAFGFETDCGHG